VRPGSPGEPSRTLSTPAKAVAPPSYVNADVEFMQSMIHHHAQAVQMVELLKTRTKRADMKLLGERMAVSQTDEIGMMKRWLADRGQAIPMDHGQGMTMMNGAMMPPMPGMLTAAEMTALEHATGAEFDRLFLIGMIKHHEGALMMVERLLNTSGAAQESVIFDFVEHVDADQRMEIARMRQMLRDTQ